MKKNIVRWLLILSLAVAVILILFNRNRGVQEGISGFIPNDLQAIDKIAITTDNDTVELLKSNNEWRVNGITKASTERMEFLMTSLNRLRIVSPVSRSAKEEVRDHLLSQGRHVRFFANGRERASFRIHYDTADIPGTYLLPEGSNDLYMVRITGFSGNDISGIFEPGFQYWLDDVLFDLDPQDIREVHVVYPEQPNQSFHIVRTGEDRVSVAGLQGEIREQETNQQSLTDYLYFFSGIHFEYPSETAFKLQLGDRPFVRLEVATLPGSRIRINAYRIMTDTNGTAAFDLNRFVGLVNDNQDTIILRYRDMDPVFRQLEDFKQ